MNHIIKEESWVRWYEAETLECGSDIKERDADSRRGS